MWYSYRYLLDQKPTSEVVYFIKYSVVDGESYHSRADHITMKCIEYQCVKHYPFNIFLFVSFQQKIKNCVPVFVTLTVITVQVSLCKDFSYYSYDKYSYRHHQNWTGEELDVKDTIVDLLFFQKGGVYSGYLQQRLTSSYIVCKRFSHKNFFVFSHFQFIKILKCDCFHKTCGNFLFDHFLHQTSLRKMLQ